MSLTTAQLATLRAAINADGVFSQLPNTPDNSYFIAQELNKLPTTDFLVWNPTTSVQAIFDAVTWANFTPADAADNTATFTNRALVIQTKQMNLQNMLQGRTTVDATLANFRAGLRDAVIQLPAGASGAMVSAGGVSGATVLTACLRKATRAEQIFASGNASTGSTTGNLLTWSGVLQPSDVDAARAN
jgi:hypothetical protein